MAKAISSATDSDGHDDEETAISFRRNDKNSALATAIALGGGDVREATACANKELCAVVRESASGRR
jgi:hypothetical protein